MWDGAERRKMPLSEEQLEAIAEKAAERAVKKLTAQIYQDIGRGFVKRALWMIGSILVALGMYLTSKGSLPLK